MQKQPMRIGELTDTFLPITDGVGRVVHAYANELTAIGHHVSVIAPMYDTGYRGGYSFELIEYVSHRVPTAPQYRTGSAAADSHYRRRIRHVPLDIVHTHSPFASGREALRLANTRNVPLVASFHSKYYDDFLKVTKSEVLAKAVVSGIVNFYEKCDDVWAVSESTANVLRSYGYKGSLHVMPNGVTIRTITQEGREQLAQKYPLPHAPILLFVGQINWKKNLLRVLEAASLLKKEGQAFHLVLAGQGPDERAVKAKAQEMGLTESITFTGHLQSTQLLDALYERADLLVFPSLYDNAPMVVREAAVMGTAPVLIRGSDAAEVVRDGENGLLCLDTGEDLARVLSAALKDLATTKQIGESARQTIPLPWHQVMTQVVQGYERVIDNFAGRRRSLFKIALQQEEENEAGD